MLIRSAEPGDLDFLYLLENACFSDPWSRESIEEEISNRRMYFRIAEDGGRPAGAMLTLLIPPYEAQIASIAVLPEFRRRGISQALIADAVSRAKDLDIESFFLEVRVSNLSAQALYKKNGFFTAGLRKGYYADNGEDALVMQKDLKDEK